MYLTQDKHRFHYNPITGDSRWDPPLRNKKSKPKTNGRASRGKVAHLPRSPNSIYAYGCDKPLNNEPVTASSSSEDEEEEEISNSFSSSRLKNMDRFSVVRDSIR